MIRVVVADDHAVVRQGIRALLVAQPDIEVVAEAGDGAEAVDLAERLCADVLVLDLVMPHHHGLEAIRHATRRIPRTRVLVLSMYCHESYVVEALRGGALGYLPKDATSTELVRAVRAVGAGERYLASALSEHAVHAWERRLTVGTPPDPYDTLTPREREVLRLAAEGLGNAEIGAHLFISPRTVEIHRGRVMRKLGFGSVCELVRFAIRRGLVPLER